MHVSAICTGYMLTSIVCKRCKGKLQTCHGMQDMKDRVTSVGYETV